LLRIFSGEALTLVKPLARLSALDTWLLNSYVCAAQSEMLWRCESEPFKQHFTCWRLDVVSLYLGWAEWYLKQSYQVQDEENLEVQ